MGLYLNGFGFRLADVPHVAAQLSGLERGQGSIGPRQGELGPLGKVGVGPWLGRGVRAVRELVPLLLFHEL